MVALAAGKEAFSDYSHVYSPKKFTQPQLFACLVLKEFEKKDYRGIRQLLLDCPELLPQSSGLKPIPHYTTLQKASRRLLRQDRVRLLINDTVRRIRRRQKQGRASRRRGLIGGLMRTTPAAISSGGATIKKSAKTGRKNASATSVTVS